MVKAPGRKMSPPSSCLLYQVPKKAKLPRHSAPGLALAAPRKAADFMPAALPLALAQVWLPPKIPEECQQGCAWRGGSPGAVCGYGLPPGPCRNTEPPEGRSGCRLSTLRGQPPGWQTCIASHATRMAVTSSSTDGRQILPCQGVCHGICTLPQPGSPLYLRWRSQVFRRPVPRQLPTASLAQASPISLYPVLPSTICSPGAFFPTCLQCRFYFFLVHGNCNRGSR